MVRGIGTFFNTMTIEVGKKYRTRGGLVAETFINISTVKDEYPIRGRILTADGKERPAYWTSSGTYVIGHESKYDLVEEICE